MLASSSVNLDSASARLARSRPARDRSRVGKSDVNSDEEGDSPLSTPHMSISLFLDGDSNPSPPHSASRPTPSAPPPPRSVHESASQLLSSSPSSPSASYSDHEPTELYFQSGDVIFVVPPPPAAHYAASTFSSNSISLSPIANKDGVAGAKLPPCTSTSSPRCSVSSSVLSPSTHLVHVYVLPSLSCISTLRGHDSCVEQVYRDEWCDVSDQVITQTTLGSVYVWSLSTSELVQRMEAKSEWLSAFLMTRRLFPLPAITQVSSLVLDDSQMSAATSHAMDDEDDAMLSGVSATACVYENQRFYPLLGWSSKLLPTDRPPFSNARGSRELSKKQFKLLPRWRWTSGWEVLRDDTTDVDGWSYAIDFSSASRNGEYRGFHRKAFIHSVRRRKWVRHRQTTHEPTAEALASATLDDYIEHKQSTPLLPPTTDSPHLEATRALSHSPAKVITHLPDKPPRSTPLLSPTPIKTRSRKAKTGRHHDHFATEEPQPLNRPTSRSTASDHDPRSSKDAPASYSPSPHSAHVLPVSSSTSASTSTSPSLPSPKSRTRHVSAISRDNSAGKASSPPASPSTLSSMLSRVKVEMQPSDEIKQTIKRMLLSHHRPAPGKPANPASATNTAPTSSSAASSNRLRAPRTSRQSAGAVGGDKAVDEQKERRSSFSQQHAPLMATIAAGQHSAVSESKEADVGSPNTLHMRRVKESQLLTTTESRDVNKSGAVQRAEVVRRKRPISFNTLPSPPRSGSVHSLILPSAASSLPSSPPALPVSPPASPLSQLPPSAVQVEVWENQRIYPVLGWSARLLPTDPPPFSDSAGHVLTLEMCELMLPLDMDWLTDWTAQRSADTDADGWLYAVDWGWEWSSKQRVLSTVRRRCWLREKAVRKVGPNMAGSKLDRVRRRKQLMTTLPATLHSSIKRPGSGGSGNSVAHSRSQSLYAPAGLPLSSSLYSLSSLASSTPSPASLSPALTVSSRPRRPSLPASGHTEVEYATPPAYYDPSAGEPEEL